MKHSNFLGELFKFASNIINSAEHSFLDLLSALVPYAVPIIPAYLTFYHTRDMMDFPPNVAGSAAFVVEVLGITSVSTSIRFWRHNLRYKTETNRAPFWLALATYVFYIVVVLAVNVILEIETAQRTPTVIWAIGLFSLLSVPSGVLISIRTQYAQMLEERQSGKGHAGAGLKPANAETDFTGVHRVMIEKQCEACRKPFKTRHTNKRTCSDACRKRLSRANSAHV